MNFTAIFIRRPVLSVVVSLALLVIGLRAFMQMPVRQYPFTQNAIITISTSYFGASPETIAGFITTPIENAVAQANGIDYLTSKSVSGQSTITATLRLNYDGSKALGEIMTLVTSVRNQLPADAQQSNIRISVGQTLDVYYLSFNSDILKANQITDYVVRVVQPQLQAVEGVQTVDYLGPKNFALRAWLDPDKLAAYGLTASDVSTALGNNDFLSAVGRTRGQMVQVNLTASTSVQTLEGFQNLILKSKNGSYVRLSDVAKVTLGNDSYDQQANFDGKPGLLVGIKITPTSNVLDVVSRLQALVPRLQAQLPNGIHCEVVYDTTEFIRGAINGVTDTLIAATIIVILVIFAFLGSPRAVLIPILTIPLSLVGAGIFMLIFGFSTNLLSLLALVLGVGLVVDDAIIVVENVSRHLEEGRTPMDAALIAARELAGPIVAMTMVLVAVYVPIAFIGGLTGALFIEFAFTLVGAVIISAILALTLSPMLASRILRSHADTHAGWEKRTVLFIDERFERLRFFYQRMLHSSLNQTAVIYVFSAIILCSIYFLFGASKSELAPDEDQGLIRAQITPSPTATLDQLLLYQKQVLAISRTFPEINHVFQITSLTQVQAGNQLRPWSERKRSGMDLVPLMLRAYSRIAGVRIGVFQAAPLPGPQGDGVQLVIKTTQPFSELNAVSQDVILAAQKTGLFAFMDSDLKFDQPQTEVVIDRNKVASLGLTMRDVGSALTSMLGGGFVNYFAYSGRAYQVIPQVAQRYRLNASQLQNYYIRTSAGTEIPLSTVAHLRDTVVPEALNHFQAQNAATITAIPVRGLTTGDALAELQRISADILPQGYTLDYAGPTRQFVQESSALLVTFGFAMIIIFLTLAALFESFRDPFIIMVSVPMSVFGALIFIALGVGGASLNIYTEMGLVTLIGLISKHGILMTKFANDLQMQGHLKRDAIEQAAAIRLRPILMTTAAMVLGVLPLVFASGPGSASRYDLGLVIATGISIGTCFTLFVVPAFYLLLATDHHGKTSYAAEADGSGQAALGAEHEGSSFLPS